ncbi:uncharacterized protein T551_02555 [Pneumocystis jirovecii RU7]|uniref:amidase n=1 Tax=Pneumocystis jirovecii (strain RU7) TaxID=1408657 RepID=A0A0W4ZJZ7_PNEJ7|nr:uncharacterized protein T551_02555 [Pneumocystis jirovecii RU7]KTW28705.1 hypothetical protein T551_02555 [Pneumocystis jirovecii RU7]
MISFQNLKKIKQKQRQVAIRKALILVGSSCPVDGDEEFLSASAEMIAKKIARKEPRWTATNVVKAYIRSAIRSNEKNNFMTEVFFVEAIEQAALLDEELACGKPPRGPLHGVPVSFKDTYNISGYDSSLGMSMFVSKPSLEDSALVKMIKDMGAVILFKTNVPQTLFAFECSNPIFGRTFNPFSATYTCGGSSGGEAVSLASNSSALGFGSDIGGSLRIPAHYCGIYALKPSSDRFPLAGHFSIVEGFEGVRVVTGPMARSVLDLKFITKAILSSEPESYDFSCIPLSWRESLRSTNFKVFGYYFEDEFTLTSPACRRAVRMVIDSLKAFGHKVVEIRPPSSFDAVEIFIGLTSSDGYKRVYDFVKKDPMEKNIWLPMLASWVPYFLKRAIGYIVENIICDPKFSMVFKAVGKKKTIEYCHLIYRRNLYRKEWFKIWNEYKLDGIIAPTNPLPALPHNGTASVSAIAASTFIYNLLNYSVGSLPVTYVDRTMDVLSDEYKKWDGLIHQKLYQSSRPLYDPDKMHGLPVGVQVIAQQWQEEKVIEMMSDIENALNALNG